MTYEYVSEAQLYGGMPAPTAQQLGGVQYAQPLAYAEPRVQVAAGRGYEHETNDEIADREVNRLVYCGTDAGLNDYIIVGELFTRSPQYASSYRHIDFDGFCFSDK